jgi:hypothetical protein
VDTCTVTAPDATTAFAVPSPSGFSQSLPVFSGLAAQRLTPSSGSLSLLRTGHIVYANPFSRRRELNYKRYQAESMPVFSATVEEFVEIIAAIAKSGAGITFSCRKIAAAEEQGAAETRTRGSSTIRGYSSAPPGLGFEQFSLPGLLQG